LSKQLGLAGLVVGQRSSGVEPSHLPQKMSRAWVDVMAGVPLFAGLSRRQLTKLAKLASTKRYVRGSAVVKVGATGECLFVILDGRANVRAGTRRIALGVGDFFGEMSLLDGEPRSATVTAHTDVLVMMLPRRKFLKLLESEPGIAITVMATLSRRVRALQAAAGV
jgi:CRP-like cAMP-binding protein